MKPCFFAAIAVILPLSTSSAAPRVVVSTPSFTPDSEVEIVFDHPVVGTAQIGTPVSNAWFEIQPALPGKVLWKSPTSAVLQPDAAPAIATTYALALRQGLTHADGRPLPAVRIGQLATEPFHMVRSFVPNRWDSGYETSSGSWILIFNDAVDPKSAEGLISFRGEHAGPIAAVIDQPDRKTLRGEADDAVPWSQRGKFQSSDHAAADDSICPVALRIRAAKPLPAGKDWRISLAKGIANSGGTARTVEDGDIQIGEIQPFIVKSAKARVVTDEPRRIEIKLSHYLPESLPAEFLSRFVRLSPEPASLSVRSDDRTLVLDGNFTESEYHLTLLPGLPSRSGYTLAEPFQQKLEFEHLEPQVALPSDNVGQFAAGTRQYRIYTRNLATLHLEAKQLSGENLVRAYQGYRHVSGNGPNYKSIRPTAPLPSALILGNKLLDQTLPLDRPIDTSHIHELQWDAILPARTRHAVMFLTASGTANPQCGDGNGVTAQSIIQLTDLGLAWKFTQCEALVYAYSCETGKPLPKVVLTLYGEEAAPLATATTDASGIAKLPRSADNRHLLATCGSDQFITEFDANPATVGLWHFPVRTSWRGPGTLSKERRLFWFTDRSLYRPGETIRLKGILRDQDGNAVVPPTMSAARIAVIDPTDKEIFTAPVTFSASASFDLAFTLPPERLGDHRFRLEFPEEIRAAEAIPENGDRWYEREQRLEQARFELPVRVAQFRRNAFETELQIQPPQPAAPRVAATLKASYFQGTPVGGGKVSHTAAITPINPYPQRFRDFLFGDHREEDWRYWYHYFDFQDPERDSNVKSTSCIGETQLDPNGAAEICVDLPAGKFPTARSVTIRTEVTDSNLQTLSATAETTVHPASLYVGVSRLDRLHRVGEAVPFKVVATTPDGEPYPAAVQLTATVTRQVNLPVRTQGENGATTTENQTTEETVSTSKLNLDPAASNADGQLLTVTPTSNGLHFLTLSGTDPEGRPFATVCRFQVYGRDEFPWQYEDGLRIRLVAEKPSYHAGETARVLVLSPIEGTALVTVEREKVLRSFVVPLKATQPVVEIPLSADDAPNAFVSVLVVKGALESARKFPQPQLRLGYCELKIVPDRETLAIELPSDLTTCRPGDEMTVSGKVRRHDGSPAENAEVTLYAEDEGTLAVIGYETPNPLGFFLAPRNLTVEAGISFENFIPEDPEMQSFNTKGFFVGGGGGFTSRDERLRRRFDPCATWAPALITARDGTFSHTFRLPDTLTRYRLIAVAHQGADRFGRAESAMTAKKDVMLEVKTPRSAHQGDAPVAMVTLQNDSSLSGTWQVRCGTASRMDSPPCQPADPASREVVLPPGQSVTLEYPLTIVSTGEAVLQWSANPVNLGGAQPDPQLTRRLSDAVETRFPCLAPVPLLREVRTLRLPPSSQPANLLESVPAETLAGQGSLTVEISPSPLVEAAGAVDFLLQYPYGCVEQTTSALIPWCTVESLSPHLPALAKVQPEAIRATLQAGANRLLSMQQADGGFSYWPGGGESLNWVTPYAGLGLVLASNAGAKVPSSAIDSLCQRLTESLRGMAETKSPAMLEQHARALLTLSLAGKPQTAYLNSLADRMRELSPTTRAFLAAAIALAAPEQPDRKAAAAAVMKGQSAETNATFSTSNEEIWTPELPTAAIALLAWSAIDVSAPETHQALDRLLHDRSPYGHWTTTWANGWSLLAISRCAPALPPPGSQSLQLTTAVGTEVIPLGPESGAVCRQFPLSPQLRCALTTPAGVSVRVVVASRPAAAPIQPVSSHGLSVDRMYERILADGSSQPLTEPVPGELIRTTLRVTLPNDGARFLVIDDPLPAIFETVDATFESQAPAAGAGTQSDWRVSHSELRDDRAMFFVDHVPSHGTYSVSYLCRCTLPGEALAPQTKVEAMYDPANFALSAARRFITISAPAKR